MYHTIYKTTHIPTGRFYIGKHSTNDPDDEYLGSGRALRKAIKKHGRDEFVKEVLFSFETSEEMDAKERELVTEEVYSSKTCFNMGPGGEGGPHFKGRQHSEESKRKMGRPGRKLSSEARKKISEGNSRRTLSPETREKLRLKALEREESKRILRGGGVRFPC